MRKIILLLIVLCSIKTVAQVNLPTGSATFGLPMFSWQDDKSRLNSVIELNYNSGNGLKVNDVASNVGQGWNLVQGGVIARMQVGEPDDQKAYIYNTPEQVDDLKKYPNGFLYSHFNVSYDPGCPSSLTTYPIFKDKNHLYKQHNIVAEDRELDYFSFSFNGRTGMFVLNKNTLDTTVTPNTCDGTLIGDSRLKVWCKMKDMTLSQQIRTTIDTFFVQDENGLIYKFAEHDISQVLKTQYCDKKLNATYKQPKLKSGRVAFESSFPDVSIKNPYVINGWYLSAIIDPHIIPLRAVSFTYNTEVIQADAGASITYYDPKNYSIITHSFSYSRSPKIASITYPDGHQALFNYGAFRIDLNGGKILSSVDIKYQNRYISKYIFNTGYVILNRFGNPVSSYEKSSARLFLKSVKKIGVDLKAEDHPYLFDYFLGSSSPDDFVPPPFLHLKDIWGYYNGYNSKEVNGTPLSLTKPLVDLKNVQLKGLCFLQDNISGIVSIPKPGYAKNGLLKQITYPTGGSLNYDYEQNKFYSNNQNSYTGGVHVLTTTLTDGGYANNCNNPIVTNYQYSLDANNTQSSLWGVTPSLNFLSIDNYYKPQDKYYKFKFPYLPIDFTCDYTYKYPGILSRDNITSLNLGQELLVISSKVVSVVSDFLVVLDIVKFAAGATGPAAVIIDAITAIVSFVVDCLLNPAKSSTTDIYYNSDLNASNPLPVQFGRVEVFNNKSVNGNTVYEFTTSTDYPVWVLSNPSFSMKQRFPYWAYGLTKKITINDASGNPVQQTENIYDPTNIKNPFYIKGSILNFNCTKCLVTASASQKETDWKIPANYSIITHQDKTISPEKMLVDPYNIYSGRLELHTTYERIFKKGVPSQYLETKTDYQYDPYNYQVSSITTTLSNGDKNYKTIRYDNALLQQNNIINTPYENTTFYTKNGSSTPYYTGESITDYAAAANGNIVPSATRVKRFVAPVTSASFSSAPYTTAQTLTYDNFNSNLIGIKDEGGHTVTNIYDYYNKYVTASVINADAILDKSAYTSFETPNLTGWQITGTPFYNYTLGVTGTTSFVLSTSNSITSAVNSSKPYIVSFWSTNTVSVSPNATLVKTATNINAFVYYEYSIAANTPSITISGNANIDEVRLYPKNARMRTVTYDPLIGKTSECDENNRITYYEHDELGRLRFIKDEKSSVVKMYEYNLKSKVRGCPATYHNLAVSEVFTKTNCAAGYQGVDTAYTIPDSKYTSTISQEDVDQKVQAELDAMGQNFANSYGICKKIFYSPAISQTFYKEGCDDGSKGTAYTYSIPYGKYTSIVDQPDADTLALDDVEANGQALANFPGNASCIIDTNPQWQGDSTAPTQCQQSNGAYTGHQLILLKDVNPNSSSYNQTQWVDMGVNTAACPASCSFSSAPGFTVVAGSPYNSGGTVNFYIVFQSNSGTTSWSLTNTVANVNGACRPSGSRTLSMSENGRTWEVIISTYGAYNVRLVSGPTPPAGYTIGLTGGSYPL